jgi:hypothetical protein
METVIENKINKLFNKFSKIDYNNPFINSKIIKYANDLGVRLIPKSLGLNSCSPLGFFQNKMCEIVLDNLNLTDEQIIHMNKIKQSWDFIPYIIIVDSINGKIIDIQEFNLPKIEIPNNKWVAASYTRNYMMDDPILDYLKYNKTSNLIKPTTNTNKTSRKRTRSNSFLEHIFENGNNFERLIIEKIKSQVKSEDFIQIGESYEAKNLSNYLKTLAAIKNDIPIIYQPVLWNSSNKTFGCGDLLIKSSFASKIFPSYPIINNSNLYEVYDIKWSNLKLKSNSDELLNDIDIKPYKAQLWIYTQALNKMQNMKATRAFLIGKNYYREKIVNKQLNVENYNSFEKLALIDYTNESEESNIEKTIEAIEWIKEVKKNKKLCIDPPNDSRLYPNMKNTQDNEFHSIKKKLAEKNKEITLLYSVGKRSRDLALENGITSYDDPKLNTKILGINSSTKTGELIDSIININKNDSLSNYGNSINFKNLSNYGNLSSSANLSNYGNSINFKNLSNYGNSINFKNLSNYGNWKDSKVRCYVDIETIGSTVYNLGYNKPNFIFMIGLGIVIDNIWTFYVYTADKIDILEENRIIKEFSDQMNLIASKYSLSHIPIFHWSDFENTNLKPYILVNQCYKFYDMCKWFKDDQICIKGALDFKLKNVTKALYNLKLINIQWDDNVSGGVDAMNQAYNYYKYQYSNISNPLKNIEYYNQIDCKSMWEIHNVLNNF